jgi:hypothetical protein
MAKKKKKKKKKKNRANNHKKISLLPFSPPFWGIFIATRNILAGDEVNKFKIHSAKQVYSSKKKLLNTQ